MSTLSQLPALSDLISPTVDLNKRKNVKMETHSAHLCIIDRQKHHPVLSFQPQTPLASNEVIQLLLAQMSKRGSSVEGVRRQRMRLRAGQARGRREGRSGGRSEASGRSADAIVVIARSVSDEELRPRSRPRRIASFPDSLLFLDKRGNLVTGKSNPHIRNYDLSLEPCDIKLNEKGGGGRGPSSLIDTT